MSEPLNLTDGVRKLFLMGVGAAATGAEKSQEIFDDLVKKGELTVEQGKALNEELHRTVEESASGASDAALRAHLKSMSVSERADFLKRAQEISSDLDAETTGVEVD